MRISKNHWLKVKPIVHRGVIDNNVVENSISSFKFCAEKNLPIEIDVFLTKDEKIVVFHDDSLERVTGEKAFIWEKTYDELKKLKLEGSNETIPLLSEVFDAVKNNAPLLIEIKPQKNKKIVEKLLEELKDFKGEYAIFSFNPLFMLKIKKYAPNVLRGLLATDRHASEKNFVERFVVKKLPFNFLVKPDFIAYNVEAFPVKKKFYKNKLMLAWTVYNDNLNTAKKYADNIIFENIDLKNLL